MTTILSLKSPWRNGDGMNVYFPGDAGIVTRGGERDYDGRRETFVEIDLTKIAAYNATSFTIVAENVTVPVGAFIEDVEIVATKTTTGSSAYLDAGLVSLADRTTEIDFNGLVAASQDFTAATVGKRIRYNEQTTYAGALIGTKLATAGLIVAACSGANYTAGKIELRVHWWVPLAADL